MDKTNCSVYVFNVLCSACFSMEWNIPNVDLFSKWITNTRPRHTHTHNMTHTYMYLHCDVEHTEEIKTVWLLMDGLMKDEDSSFFVPIVSVIPVPPHTNTQIYRLSWTHHPLICAVRGGGRQWQLTGLKQSACASGRLFGPAGVIISPITSIDLHDPSSSGFSPLARLERTMRIMEIVAHLYNVSVYVWVLPQLGHP